MFLSRNLHQTLETFVVKCKSLSLIFKEIDRLNADRDEDTQNELVHKKKNPHFPMHAQHGIGVKGDLICTCTNIAKIYLYTCYLYNRWLIAGYFKIQVPSYKEL